MTVVREATKRQLAAVAAQRTLDTEHRARKALRELDRERAAISFVSVAQRARVSRAFLYAHAELREELAIAHGRVRELELDRRVHRR